MLSTDGAEASAARVGSTSDDSGEVDMMLDRGGRSETVPAQSSRYAMRSESWKTSLVAQACR